MLRYFHYWIFNKFSKTQHTQRFSRRRTVQSAVREMAPQNTRTADDKLAKWVFGIARIFGYWMFNEETTRNNRLKRAKTTAGAWLRVLITLVIYSLFLWFQIHYSPGSYIHRPTNGTKLLLLSFNVRLMSTMLSVSMNIWNRHNLLEIISINQEFDNEVSIYEYHLNMIIIHATTKQKKTKILQMKFIGYNWHQQRFRKKYIMFVSMVSVSASCTLISYYIPSIQYIFRTQTNDKIVLYLIHTIIVVILRYAQIAALFLYTYCLLNVYMRLRLLNFALHNVNGTSNAIPRLYIESSDGLIGSLNRLAVQHSRLTDAIERINQCYSFQVSRLREHSIFWFATRHSCHKHLVSVIA